MSLFSHPLYTVVNSYYAQEITAQFFFYSKSIEEEFIVYLRQNSYAPFLIFDFFRYNGDYVFTKKMPVPGMKRGEYDQLKIKISPNGRYLCIKEQYNASTETESKTFEESKFFGSQTDRFNNEGESNSSVNEGGENEESSDEPSEESSDESSEESSSQKEGSNPSSKSHYQSTGLNGEEKDNENISEASSDSDEKGVPIDNEISPNSMPTGRATDKRSNINSSMPIPNGGPAHDSNKALMGANTSRNADEERRPKSMINRSYKFNQRSDRFYKIEPHDENKSKGFYRSEFPRMDAKIYELVLLRRSSIVRSLKWACRKIKYKHMIKMALGPYRKAVENLKKKMENEESQFDLKLVRTIEDIHRLYGDYSDDNYVLTNELSLA